MTSDTPTPAISTAQPSALKINESLEAVLKVVEIIGKIKDAVISACQHDYDMPRKIEYPVILDDINLKENSVKFTYHDNVFEFEKNKAIGKSKTYDLIDVLTNPHKIADEISSYIKAMDLAKYEEARPKPGDNVRGYKLEKLIKGYLIGFDKTGRLGYVLDAEGTVVDISSKNLYKDTQ